MSSKVEGADGEVPIPPKKVQRRATELVREADLLTKKKGKKVDEAARDQVKAAADATRALIPTRKNKVALDPKALLRASIDLDQAIARTYGRWRKSALREMFEAIAWALGLALLIRFFLFEAFSIPSSSMYPTLHIGDHLFVNKLGLGVYWPMSPKRAIEWDQPDHGDIIVFVYRSPDGAADPLDGEDFIKRVVAVPGDRVRLEDDRIVLNGKPIQTEVVDRTQCAMFGAVDYDSAPRGHCPCVVQRETIGDETWLTQHFLPGCGDRGPDAGTWPLEYAPKRRYFGDRATNPNWPDVLVPEGHVLVMGDNRDASEDGRFWGFVPYERIKGKAFVIFYPFSRIFTWLD